MAETAPESDELGAQAARIEHLRSAHTDSQRPSSGLSTLYLFFSLGTSMAGCLLAGFLGGQWLDNHFATKYWVLVGLLIGLVSGIMGAYRLLKPFLQG